MAQARFVPLPDRGVLRLAGEDARAYLQGLVSNDVRKVAADKALYAALLTPQGKFLFDFFIVEHDGALLLDVERARKDDLVRRLTLYRLRAKVTIEDVSDRFAVVALPDAVSPQEPTPGAARPFAEGVAFTDPRLADLGERAIVPAASVPGAFAAAGMAPAPIEAYDRLRLGLGVPDGSRDLEIEKSFLIENNIDELNGIDFDKGCYVGQELTARTKYRAVVRKRLFRVDVDGPLPAPGTPVRSGEIEIGTMRSGRDGVGLAFLRLDGVEQAAGAALVAGEARLRPVKPDWARF
jgi:folate-binding protein YgfZ